jgi:hypothetical protein
MYRSPYDISNKYDNHPFEEYNGLDKQFFNNIPINVPEAKVNRDQIQFPNALPSNSCYPIHQQDYNFTDRQFQNDRKCNNNLPVQNEYLHKYQFDQMRPINSQSYEFNQSQIDRMMDKKAPSDCNQMLRNFDDAKLFGKQHATIMPNQFITTPQDTRKVKELSDDNRAPMSKVLGAPPKYTHSRYL